MRSDVPVQSASSVFCFACTTGSWHVTVPQATIHCPNLHHWVMARHSTAGHSPLPQTAPAALAPPRAPGLGQQLSPVFIPLRVTHTAVTPHGRRPTHPSSRRSFTWSELIASSGTSLLHELHDARHGLW